MRRGLRSAAGVERLRCHYYSVYIDKEVHRLLPAPAVSCD